jgi:hypothetical protein
VRSVRRPSVMLVTLQLRVWRNTYFTSLPVTQACGSRCSVLASFCLFRFYEAPVQACISKEETCLPIAPHFFVRSSCHRAAMRVRDDTLLK